MARPRKKPGDLGKVSTAMIRGAWRARASVRDGAGNLHMLEAWGATQEAAVDAVSAKAHELWGGLFIGLSAESTIGEIAASWLTSIGMDESVTQSSREAYANAVRLNVLPYASAVPVAAVTPGFLHQLLLRLQRERSYSYASKTRKVMSLILSHAVLNGVIASNPMREVPKLKSPRKQIQQLELDQVIIILNLIRDWRGRNPERAGGSRPNVQFLEDYFLIALGTSMRPGEVLALRPEDVSLGTDQTRLTIAGTVIRTKMHGAERQDHPKRSGQTRSMMVPRYTATVLRRLVACYRPNPDNVLLTTKNGTPYTVNYVDRLFRDFRKQHEVQLREVGVSVDLFVPYILRKTVAGAINDAGGKELASKVLGHSSLRTLSFYVEEKKEVDPRAALILDEAFPANSLMSR